MSRKCLPVWCKKKKSLRLRNVVYDVWEKPQHMQKLLLFALYKMKGGSLRECRCVDRVVSLSLECHEQEPCGRANDFSGEDTVTQGSKAKWVREMHWVWCQGERQIDFNYNACKAALYWYFSNILIRGLTLQLYISAIDLAVQTYWISVLSI